MCWEFHQMSNVLNKERKLTLAVTQIRSNYFLSSLVFKRPLQNEISLL